VNFEAGTFLVAVVLVPLVILWLTALFHIVAKRPDLSIAWKGIWSAAVVFVPYVGVLLYGMLRPPRPPERTGGKDPTAVDAAFARIGELQTAHDEGAISDAEYAEGKRMVFGLTDSTV